MDEYQYPGFRPRSKIKGMFGDPKAVVITLVRRQKKRCVGVAEQYTTVFMITRLSRFVTYLVETLGSIWRWRCGGWTAGCVAK